VNTSLSNRRRFSQLLVKNSTKKPEKKVQTFNVDYDFTLNHSSSPQASYYNSKLSHQGITSYKVFEGFNRFRHPHSLANLLNQKSDNSEAVNFFTEQFKACSDRDSQCRIIDQAIAELDLLDYQAFLSRTCLTRTLNPNQSRKLRYQCQKLEYYSQSRKFVSKKSGSYTFRVAFLTLTAPGGTNAVQMLNAFEHFLDYLRRTANCVFVWKKELGEKNSKLHFHLMINNFVPYYIIDWKWKRLLINEGVTWPLNEKGIGTRSHYRIEIPRSKRKIGHYISKYMSKAYALPSDCGYVSGHSKLLDTCEEIKIIEYDLPGPELEKIMSSHKVIRTDFVTHVCVNLLHIKAIAPKLGALFEAQYIKFSEILTLPQKFHEV
jgi:hypothetical protein